MGIERRDFIRAGVTGLSGGLLATKMNFAQSRSAQSSGKLLRGTGSVHVEGRLKSGVLTVDAQEFTEGEDRCVVINGRLASTDLYCSYFSYKRDESIFTVLRSNGHTTSLTLSNSGDPKIANLVAWHDSETPVAFRIDKDKFLDQKKFKEAVLEGKGDSLDLVGKRNPPAFTLDELEAVFGKNAALNDFMRGHRSHHNLLTEPRAQAFDCFFLSSIPGNLAGLDWIVGDDNGTAYPHA